MSGALYCVRLMWKCRRVYFFFRRFCRQSCTLTSTTKDSGMFQHFIFIVFYWFIRRHSCYWAVILYKSSRSEQFSAGYDSHISSAASAECSCWFLLFVVMATPSMSFHTLTIGVIRDAIYDQELWGLCAGMATVRVVWLFPTHFSQSEWIHSEKNVFVLAARFTTNKNTFCGTRYLSHCHSLHGTVVAVTWPWPCSLSEIFSEVLGMLAKLEVWIFSRFGAIII